MEEKKIEFRFDINQDLIVYKDNIAYPQGAVVRVMDRSKDDPETYLVISLQDLGAANGDLNRMYAEHSKWVHQDDCQILEYARPEKVGLFVRLWRAIFG